MNIRYYLTVIAVLLGGLLLPAHAQTYDNLWNKVEQWNKKDLPRSALDEVQAIYRKAKAEKNAPQMMKAYLTMMDLRGSIAPDSLDTDLRGLEEWAATERDSIHRPVLYAVLGGVLMNQDPLRGLDYLRRSLTGSEALVAYPASRLRPMTETGDASRKYFNDNLYDLLARNAIQGAKAYGYRLQQKGNQTLSLPAPIDCAEALEGIRLTPASEADATAFIMQTYGSLLNIYTRQGNRAAWLLTALDASDYLYNNFRTFYPQTHREKELREWIDRYKDLEVCTEAYIALAQQTNNRMHPAQRLQLVREGIARYPGYARTNALRNIEKSILSPSLHLNVSASSPNQPLEINASFRNLTGFTLYIYKLNLPATSNRLYSINDRNVTQYGSLVSRHRFALKSPADYTLADSTFTVTAPAAGIYYLKAVADAAGSTSGRGNIIHLTTLQFLECQRNGKLSEIIVVDRESGRPLPDAELVVYERGSKNIYTQKEVLHANAEGKIVNLDLHGKNNIYYQARRGNDVFMPLHSYVNFARDTQAENPVQTRISLFTDRSTYRPGQRVQFSGLAYRQQGDSLRVATDGTYTVTLWDANNKEIARTEMHANSFGSFSGEFVLPQEVLTGMFMIRVGNDGSAVFQVEEYKRPTFTVTFDTIQAEYSFGDSLRAVGRVRTFAGAPVQGAKVQYKIARMDWVWRSYGGENYREKGETVTDANGRFEVPVKLLVPNHTGEGPMPLSLYQRYAVTADVTSTAGETQTGNFHLPVGSSSLRVRLDMKQTVWLKETPRPLTVEVSNLYGEAVETEADYTVYAVTGTGERGDSITGKVRSGKPWMAEALYALPSGMYELVVTARDNRGRASTAQERFELFSGNDRKTPYHTASWNHLTAGTFNDAEPPVLYVGSSEQDVYLFYSVCSGNKELENRCIHFSDSLLSFRFPYREEYDDGVFVQYAFVKRGVVYHHTFRIEKPQPDKRLLLKWSSFRDHLLPGTQEEWRLTVHRPDGTPANAELLATLYDASLDEINRHDWHFGLSFPRHIPYGSWRMWYTNPSNQFHFNFPVKNLRVSGMAYSRLLVPYHQRIYTRGGGMLYETAVRKSKAAVMMSLAVTDDYAGNIVENTSVQVKEEAEYSADAGTTHAVFESEELPVAAMPGNVPLRTNFSETAFFYPHLRTDANGEVTIAFTLPESLTRWRFLGLAHTEDVAYGTLEATATASKEFMLQSNLPRFVRNGDRATVSASLVNLSAQAVKGTVRLELFDPATEEVYFTDNRPFDVAATQTEAVHFTFDVADRWSLLACRLVAEGDTFSDGEQRYLPVLTDKQWVTETVALHMNGAGKQAFALDELFNHQSPTATERRLTVEFTGNAAWYAVLALPVLANPQNDDALSWAAAYYANSLSDHFLATHPQLKQVFDTWRLQGTDKENIANRLQANEELKGILLEETPWLAEATDEAERHKRIAALFDLNTMTGRQTEAVRRLEALQGTDGAWSWYPGMTGSRLVTTQVAVMLARLNALGSSTEDVLPMLDNAMKYLSEQAAEEYRHMKEAERKGVKPTTVSDQALQYLYIRQLHGERPADEVSRYFVNILKGSSASLSIYDKSLAAIVLNGAGETTQAQEFVRSILEYSVTTDELGRYFDTPKAGYSWQSYKIPTQVMAIEAVDALHGETTVINQLKQWLLKQKQTQAWETPVATADAVYTLFHTVPNGFVDTGKVKITLGKTTVESQPGDILGYINRSLIHPSDNIRKVSIDKKSNGIGWGAVYAQFLEEMDRLDAQGHGLSVGRSLWKNGRPITAGEHLSVGDKVTVRLTVKADRDMDFVCIKDERAACMEPVSTHSGYQWNESGLGYYQAVKDASLSFFADKMRKGTYTIDYEVFITAPGEYHMGIATARSVYAPEFGGHSTGGSVSVAF